MNTSSETEKTVPFTTRSGKVANPITNDTHGVPQPPTEIGQRVANRGYGGQVTMWMRGGTVVGFARTGNPKILTDEVPGYGPQRIVVDRAGCFALVDADGRWVRRIVGYPQM
jgi:hypothetical protein